MGNCTNPEGHTWAKRGIVVTDRYPSGELRFSSLTQCVCCGEVRIE
jgi:hypothetical protein